MRNYKEAAASVECFNGQMQKFQSDNEKKQREKEQMRKFVEVC